MALAVNDPPMPGDDGARFTDNGNDDGSDDGERTATCAGAATGVGFRGSLIGGCDASSGNSITT